MKNDTIGIGEVIIMPKFSNLKSEILNAPVTRPQEMENAKYNIAISTYLGKTTTGKLGDPASNYNFIRQQQKTEALEKGGIPSDKIAALSPFMLIPAAYLIIHGFPPENEFQ